MRKLISLLVLIVLVAGSADAQQRGRERRGGWRFFGGPRPPVEFGIRGGYDFTADVGSFGSQLRLPFNRHLSLVPNGDVFFSEGDGGADWQLNLDLLMRPARLGGLYAGAGVGFLHGDFDSDDDRVDVGGNVFLGLGGTTLLRSRLRPFAEGRWTFADDYQPFRLVLGLNAPVR